MAQSLLDQESRVTLSQRDFAAFNTAIAGAFAPNEALQKALKSVAILQANHSVPVIDVHLYALELCG